MRGAHYTAFVSYSHKDDKWTKWLLKALEAFQVPRHLVGTEGTNGIIPAKLSRIFRDREALAAGPSLDDKVREALEHSQTLLVVCSPNAVHSSGVNQEIELFRKMRGDEHIFYIIKDGEPDAQSRGIDPRLECFPKALLNRKRDTSTVYGVPLAADARDQGDGKKMALLKVVAGILGVNLDALVRRDLQRRQRRLWGFTGLATAGMLLTTALAVNAYLATKRAEDALILAQQEQDQTEGLIQYISEEISHPLWRLGERDLTEQVTERLINHYEGQNSPLMGPQEVARKIRSMRSLLRINLVHGQHKKVVTLLEETVKTTRSLTQASPEDLTLINSHAQALQILSTSYWMAGECDNAFDIAEERLGIGVALRNRKDSAFYMRARLGNALVDRGFFKLNCKLQPESAMADFRAALEIRQEMANQVEEWIGSLAGAYRFLGRGHELTGTLEDSIEAHQHSQDLYKRYTKIKPEEVLVKFLMYKFSLEMVETMLNAGQTEQAVKEIAFTKEGLKALTASHPDNNRWAASLILSDHLLGTVAFSNNEYETAKKLFGTSTRNFEKLLARLDNSVDTLNWLLSSKLFLAATNLALKHPENAEGLLSDVANTMQSNSQGFFNSIEGRKVVARYYNTLAALHQAKGDQALSHEASMAVINAYGPHWEKVHPTVRFELMKAYMAVGRLADASEIAKNLHNIGFRRVDFRDTNATLTQMQAS